MFARRVGRRSRPLAAVALACLLATVPVGPAWSESTSLAEAVRTADRLYAQRGRRVDPARRADPAQIDAAIDAYAGVLAAHPDDLGVRWRLLRALYFAGDHSSAPEEKRRARLEQGREVGRIGLDQIADRFADGTRLEDFDGTEIRALVVPDQRADVTATYYWLALVWGTWAQFTGTLEAIGDGIANRLYEFTDVVLALDPGYERGGAHRLRSYLHATLPRVPFVTGWVDRERAVPEAQAALAFDPQDRGNRVIYGLALLDTREEAEKEALDILAAVAGPGPRDESLTEDLSIRALALERRGDDPTSPYGAKPPDPDGTGRVYLGREIALVMGHVAASWLERPDRATSEMPDRVVREMDLAPDAVVADIGAGTGYFSFRIAGLVPRGEVLAVDIQPQMLEIMDRRSMDLGVSNVRTILGSSVDPRLPEGGVDAVLLVDAYHEFSHPREMGAGIARALRPGGRVFLVEYRGEDDSIPIKPLHKMTVAQSRRELEAVGLRWVETKEFLPEQHFMVFEKPGPASP